MLSLVSRLATVWLITSGLGYAQSDELRVDAPAGPVLGHYAHSGGESKVREFLGIPYAKPPVGDLRFMPPQKKEPWTEIHDASEFGPGCFQFRGVNGIDKWAGGSANNDWLMPKTENEDCLTLNIWAPNKDRISEEGAAVMIWTHGGAWGIGTSETPVLSGANLVRDQEDVIIVNYNYRLNVLGFPGAPGLGVGNNNPGIRDMRAVVEWVHANIASFGGNPNKIILFGQSAGAGSIDTYLYAYPDNPLISGAIMQSGQIALASFNLIGSSKEGVEWNKLTPLLGCPTGAAGIPCMKSIDANLLIDTMSKNNITFVPTVDGGTFFADTDLRQRLGRFARVPVLIGSNDKEIPIPLLGDLITRVGYTCPAARAAEGHSKVVPTWQYRYFGNFVEPGPVHGSEIEQVFGTYPSTATQAQVELSKYMQGAWVAFAKDSSSGLLRYGGGNGWPTFATHGEVIVRLGFNNAASPSLARPIQYQALC